MHSRFALALAESRKGLRVDEFGKLLERVEHERRSLIIEKRGRPRAVLLSLRDYVRVAAPEPDAQPDSVHSKLTG